MLGYGSPNESNGYCTSYIISAAAETEASHDSLPPTLQSTMIFSPGAITCFFHRYLFHFAVGEGGGAAVGGSLDHPSDHDPRRTSADPMTLISDKSQTKQTPLEVNVGALLANEPPGRVVTPPAAPPAGKRITRSSNQSIVNKEAGDAAAARRVFDCLLKPERGWFHDNGAYEYKKKGKRGVHYAIGELELCIMIQTYGLDHAPKDLEDIPAEPDRYSNIYEMWNWVENYLGEMEELRQLSSKKKKKSPIDEHTANVN
ncbi:hypothetical protein THAOC_23454, partial [Thalassiosira oceanica]